MNKQTVTLLSGSLALLLGACGGKESKGVDSAATRDSIARIEAEAAAAAEAAEQARLDSIRQDSIQKAEEQRLQKEADQANVKAFLKDFYDNCLFGYTDFDKYKSHFSKSVLKRFEREYDFECDNGPCYGFWVMRGDSQDSDKSDRLTDCIPLDDNWYLVKFTEVRRKWRIKIQAKVENGRVIVTDYKPSEPVY